MDELKIDKSFVDRLTADDPDALTLTSAIVAMSHALRLRTVAEGIETDHQRAQLAALGCDLGQGFHLSRPLNEHALETLLLSPRPVDHPAADHRASDHPDGYAGDGPVRSPAEPIFGAGVPSRWGQSVRDVPPGVPLLVGWTGAGSPARSRDAPASRCADGSSRSTPTRPVEIRHPFYACGAVSARSRRRSLSLDADSCSPESVPEAGAEEGRGRRAGSPGQMTSSKSAGGPDEVR